MKRYSVILSVAFIAGATYFVGSYGVSLWQKAKNIGKKAVDKTKQVGGQAVSGLKKAGDTVVDKSKQAGKQTIKTTTEMGRKAKEFVTGKKEGPYVAQKDPNGCNGYVGLCSRRYNEVAYAHSHNATTLGPSIVHNQDISLNELIKRGVRSIKVPIHFSKDMGNRQGEGLSVCHGIYRPTLYSNYYGMIKNAILDKLVAALEKLKPTLNLPGVGSIVIPGTFMKLKDLPQNVKMFVDGFAPVYAMIQRGLPVAYGNATMPPEGKVAFTPCAIDPAARSLESVLKDIKTFLDANPREIFTFHIENTVPLEKVGEAFEQAGLAKYAHVQDRTKSWPTLKEMIDANKRLVVLGGGALEKYPWINTKNTFAFSTPYAFSSKAQIENALGYGEGSSNYKNRNEGPKNKIFEINHFLTIGLAGSPGAADVVNKKDVIRRRVKTIMERSKAMPTYIGTDFTQRPSGDVFQLVDEINGVGKFADKPLVNLK